MCRSFAPIRRGRRFPPTGSSARSPASRSMLTITSGSYRGLGRWAPMRRAKRRRRSSSSLPKEKSLAPGAVQVRVRLAFVGARHLRRSQGLRVGRRQRHERPSDPEVHQRRQVRHADRPRRTAAAATPTPRTSISLQTRSCTRRRTSSSSPTATATAESSSSMPTPAGSSGCGARSVTSRPTIRPTLHQPMPTRKARRSSCSRFMPRACRRTDSST